MASSRGKSCCSSSIVEIGPWGGTGGIPWDDGGGYTGIRSITVNDYFDVEMISVEYDLFGEPVQSQIRGAAPVTPDSSMIKQIHLNFPDEFLTSITGYHNERWIKAVTFGTNLGQKFGPFGGVTSYKFSCSVDGVGAIVGFSGRSSRLINSIGLYVAVLCPANVFYEKMETQGLDVFRTSPLCMPHPRKI